MDWPPFWTIFLGWIACLSKLFMKKNIFIAYAKSSEFKPFFKRKIEHTRLEKAITPYGNLLYKSCKEKFPNFCCIDIVLEHFEIKT